AGGSPLNVAVGLARLGTPSALFTGLSTDPLGERLVAFLDAEGVDRSRCPRTGRLTTVSLVGLDADGVPAYAFHASDSADTGLKPADLPVLGPDITGLHFGSYSIAVPPVADTLAELARRAEGRLVCLDPNIRPTIEPDMGVWRARIDAFFPAVDVLKISAEDLSALHPGLTHEDFARDALSRGARLVVVTDGGDAVRAWADGGLSAEVRPPAVEIVDTVGAGDTFQAALLYRLTLNGDGHAALANMTVETLTKTLQFCAGAAAVTCTRQGADLPRLSELTHLPGA
ncbi:MAG: carbohydrate kinase family protein, partial [Rubricella sp.]